jgi:hypothetical protein
MARIARRNTDMYNLGRFKSHGRAELSFDGRFMRFSSTGPYNGEHLLAVRSAIRELIQERPPTGPWAEIIHLQGSALITPELLHALGEVIATLASEGIASAATAVVATSENVGFALMVRPYAAVYAELQRPFAAFSTVAEAEAWAEAQLAIVRP